ncbi:MAG: lysine--tRNA ligase [Puniceicoccaceae bacterium]|nr:lysine--tRNA ligase [Puniceicoccaceae bacterium]|tara:strand:- start:940 stop:2424 length:1485 start_codon:yes stop_codon:yes gene_type:complete
MKDSTQDKDNSHDLYAVRSEKLDGLIKDGRNPFTANCTQNHTAASAKELYDETKEDSEQAEVQVAGRIIAFRLMGKASFIKLQDRAGQIQCYVTRDELPEGEYNQYFKKLDRGDIIGVEGRLFKTKTGEITVRASAYTLVSKSLRPLPEKWAGLTDDDKIYRQRYLDLICNPESRMRFKQRSEIIRAMRSYLWDLEFTEVETPVLQSVAGGAAARPFETHSNALDCPFYLRIALELYLKQMLVAGEERVFEIGRVFRNEGLSRRHNPEFTMLELYQAYTDFRGMMKLTQGLIQHVAQTVIGSLIIRRPDGTEIDLGGEWSTVAYKDLIVKATGDREWFSLSKEAKLKKTEALGIEVNPQLEDYEITNNVFEKLIEPTLIQPTFVTHIPRELCPLAKITQSDASTIDVFELCINGQEIAPAYSEQNDPRIQREMFTAQVGEEVQDMDTEFLTALEYGMPPAGGMGLGIDRLIILLTGAESIRDTILFPSLKPNKD